MRHLSAYREPPPCGGGPRGPEVGGRPGKGGGVRRSRGPRGVGVGPGLKVSPREGARFWCCRRGGADRRAERRRSGCNRDEVLLRLEVRDGEDAAASATKRCADGASCECAELVRDRVRARDRRADRRTGDHIWIRRDRCPKDRG